MHNSFCFCLFFAQGGFKSQQTVHETSRNHSASRRQR